MINLYDFALSGGSFLAQPDSGTARLRRHARPVAIRTSYPFRA